MNVGQSPERRALLLSAVLLTVVFTAGVLTGAAAFDSAFAASPDDLGEVAGEPEGLDALNLSPEQRIAIDRIVAERQPEADSIIKSSILSLQTLMSAADAEVRAVLTPAQVEAYDELLAAQRPRIQAVRRTTGPDGTTVDTIR